MQNRENKMEIVSKKPPFKVLSIDGGGIRGLYSAELLTGLAARFKIPADKIGACFDLIAGTSTGGLLAAGLCANKSPSVLSRLYKEKGADIFSGTPMPESKWKLPLWMIKHFRKAIHPSDNLRLSLNELLGSQTFEEIYERNRIALCMTAVNMLDHSPRIFKTPHMSEYDRDNNMTLTDACLATSAAPLYLPLHRMSSDSGNIPNVYADGGLWMNNPAPVALIEALKMTDPSQEIMIFSVGNPNPVAGVNPASIRLNKGLFGWRAGALPLELSMNAQAQAANHLSSQLSDQLTKMGRKVTIIRATQSPVSAEQSKYLGLDNASERSLSLLTSLAEKDASETYKAVQKNTADGVILKQIFNQN